MMTSAERVRAVLNGDRPDSVPRALYGTSIGIHNQEILRLFDWMTGRHPRDAFRQDLVGLYPGFAYCKDHPEHIDALKAYAESRRSYRPEPLDITKKIPVVPEDATNPAYRRWRILCHYDMPRIVRRIGEIEREGRASVLTGTRTLLESGCQARGRQQFYMDLAYGESWLEPFLDLLTEAAIEEVRVLLASIKPDIFCYGDDVGAQKGLIISPTQWNTLFKPRHRKIVEAVKAASPTTAVAFHCCGDARELIEPLIEIGVDVLNPIQPAAMDPVEARRRAGDRLVLWGGLCVQHILPHGTPADVDREVRQLMETIGRDGRYLLTPAHLLNHDVPWDNIVAFFEAADRYG